MIDARCTDRCEEPGARPRSLREACVKAGLNRNWRRCPACPLRELCESEMRWLIKTARKPAFLC